MLESLFGNPHYKFVSLLLAVMAWLYVQSDELYEDQIQAGVDWSLSSELMPVEPLPSTVALRVRGTRAAIRRAREADVRVEVDVRDVGPGDHNLELAPFPVVNTPSNLEVLGRSPSGVRFSLDKVATRKIRVRPVVVGEVAPGFAVESVVLNPAVATISGPAIRVAKLDEVSTEPIDLTGLAGSAVQSVQLDLPRGLTEGDGSAFSANVEILAQNAERTFAEVPVHVWGTGNFRSSVQTVQVVLRGPAADLEGLAFDDLVAIAHIPPEGGRLRYEAAWGPKDGPRLRILHGASERVSVQSVEPSRLEVVAR